MTIEQLTFFWQVVGSLFAVMVLFAGFIIALGKYHADGIYQGQQTILQKLDTKADKVDLDKAQDAIAMVSLRLENHLEQHS